MRSLVVAAVLAGTVGACSGDGTADPVSIDRDEAIATISEDLRADLGAEVLDDAAAECLGTGLVDELGSDAALDLHRSPGGLSVAPADTSSTVRVVVDRCVPGSAVAPAIVSAFYASVQRPGDESPAVVDCVADELDGNTGAVLTGTAVGNVADATLPALETCLPDELLVELLVEAFEGGGATPEQARCTAETIGDQLTLSQLQAVTGAVDLPPELEEVLGTATEACL